MQIIVTFIDYIVILSKKIRNVFQSFLWEISSEEGCFCSREKKYHFP